MAILSKIRERSMALILVIGLALFAFVLDPSSIQDFFSSTKINTVGEINGETISRKEFSEALEAYKTQVGSGVTEMQASKVVWDNLVRQKIYKTQLEEAGITVGENDVWNKLIENPSIKNSPQYQNEVGLFNEEKLKENLATIREDGSDLWNSWIKFMGQIRENLEKTTYDDLVAVGLGASLKEGEAQYLSADTKITSEFVYIPYTTVSDSLIEITKSEISAYIEKHPSHYKVEESRDVKIVHFDIVPTAEDEVAIKNGLSNLISDNGQYKGLKNTTNIIEFFNENDSDTPLDKNFHFKGTVSVMIADAVFDGKKGDVFGPYKDKEYFKISKLTEVIQMPDSAKASHILIPFVGANSATPNIKQTEEEAKKTADSLLTIIKRNKSKFANLAKKFSSDKGSSEKGGEYDWFNYTRMVSEFRDFVFEGKTGDMGVVKTIFGFHIIKIDGQKNKQKAIKLATFSRKIEASLSTENTIFQNAEMVALELSNEKNLDDIAEERKLKVQSAIGLKVLDENVPTVGNERNIVVWAFNSDNKIGDFKRFDIDKGHVIVVLKNKTKKGLMSAAKAISKVRPILVAQKKAEIINNKMNGATLEEIAKANKTDVKTATKVTLQNPVISGVGSEPKIVGAMYSAKENAVHLKVEGDKGVFAFKVIKREVPAKLPNYESYRKRVASQRKDQTGNNMYNAIKKMADIEDNRAVFYGVN